MGRLHTHLTQTTIVTAQGKKQSSNSVGRIARMVWACTLCGSKTKMLNQKRLKNKMASALEHVDMSDFFPEGVCEGFFVKTSAEPNSHLHIYISALHLCTSTFSPISLLIFTSTFTSAHLHLCSSSHPHIYISHLHLSLFFTFSLKAGGGAAGAPRNATLCGDRVRREHKMKARGL